MRPLSSLNSCHVGASVRHLRMSYPRSFGAGVATQDQYETVPLICTTGPIPATVPSYALAEPIAPEGAPCPSANRYGPSLVARNPGATNFMYGLAARVEGGYSPFSSAWRL